MGKAPRESHWLQPFLLLIAVTGTAAALAYHDYIPGTLEFSPDGVASGTGTRSFQYPGGTPRISEKYVAGFLRVTRWYAADGTLAAETHWKQGAGDYYIVDDDGRVIAKFEYAMGMPNGNATFYARDGAVARTARFVNGVEVTPARP